MMRYFIIFVIISRISGMILFWLVMSKEFSGYVYRSLKESEQMFKVTLARDNKTMTEIV